jgi:hypothetical protein
MSKRLTVFLATIILAFVLTACCIGGDACGDFWQAGATQTAEAK